MGTTLSLKFEQCQKQGKIRKFSRGRALADKELKAAYSDLQSACDSFKRENYKWATVQCYYSMFHSGRAMLYIQGFREKSHYCLIIALRVLYVGKGKLSFQLIEALQKAKALREDADYYDRWSKTVTKDLLKKAKEFLEKAEELIKQDKK